MSAFQTTTGEGKLIHDGVEIATRYVLYRDDSGRAVMLELLDRPLGKFSDEGVQVILSNGRCLKCQILDDTPMCTVIGEHPYGSRDEL